MKAEGLLQKPFIPKKRKFIFPHVERMGQLVLRIEGLTHGYQDCQLFDDVELEIEKGERVAIIGVLSSLNPIFIFWDERMIIWLWAEYVHEVLELLPGPWKHMARLLWACFSLVPSSARNSRSSLLRMHVRARERSSKSAHTQGCY